jgi:hypothetical protein
MEKEREEERRGRKKVLQSKITNGSKVYKAI